MFPGIKSVLLTPQQTSRAVIPVSHWGSHKPHDLSTSEPKLIVSQPKTFSLQVWPHPLALVLPKLVILSFPSISSRFSFSSASDLSPESLSLCFCNPQLRVSPSFIWTNAIASYLVCPSLASVPFSPILSHHGCQS